MDFKQVIILCFDVPSSDDAVEKVKVPLWSGVEVTGCTSVEIAHNIIGLPTPVTIHTRHGGC